MKNLKFKQMSETVQNQELDVRVFSTDTKQQLTSQHAIELTEHETGIVYQVPVIKQNLKFLTELGAIIVLEKEPAKLIDLKRVSEDLLEIIAERKDWKVENLKKYITTTIKLHKTSAITFLLKEIAIKLDKAYPDHIRNTKTKWMISTIDGKIFCTEIPISNFNNISVFRSREEAELAQLILKEGFNLDWK